MRHAGFAVTFLARANQIGDVTVTVGLELSGKRRTCKPLVRRYSVMPSTREVTFAGAGGRRHVYNVGHVPGFTRASILLWPSSSELRRQMSFFARAQRTGGDSLRAETLDDLGMVVDFSRIKRVISGWIDANLDHKMLCTATIPILPYLQKQGEPVFLLDVDTDRGEHRSAHLRLRRVAGLSRGRGSALGNGRLLRGLPGLISQRDLSQAAVGREKD